MSDEIQADNGNRDDSEYSELSGPLILRIPEIIIGFLVLFLVVFILISVFSRYVLDAGFVWSDELGRVIFVWIVFLGLTIGLRHRAHIGIELALKLLPNSALKWVYLLQDILIFGFAVTFTWLSIDTVRFALMQRLPALQISIAWLYGAVLVTGVLLCLYALLNIIDTLRNKRHAPDREGLEAHQNIS
jgi:TRAP-type C4-dicarboxylate transport system permease small subunit